MAQLHSGDETACLAHAKAQPRQVVRDTSAARDTLELDEIKKAWQKMKAPT